MSDFGKCPGCGDEQSDTFIMCGSCDEDYIGGDGGHARFKKAIADARAAGFAEAIEKAAKVIDESASTWGKWADEQQVGTKHYRLALRSKEQCECLSDRIRDLVAKPNEIKNGR